MYDVKDEFKRQQATVMWALDLLPRKYTLEERAAVVVAALHQNYVLIPKPVLEQAVRSCGTEGAYESSLGVVSSAS
jgi:hypothetical protein